VGARPQPARPSVDRDTKSALLEALQESVVDANDRDMQRAEIEVRQTARRASPVILGCTAILVATAGWLMVARPSWVFPTAPSVRSSAQVESGLRIGLYLEARRVFEFASRTGRAPSSLEEAGVTGSASRYELLPDGRWRLSATEHGQSIRITSEDDLSNFLGSSFTNLRGGRR